MQTEPLGNFDLGTEREKEPMLLLDTTGSMNWPAAEGMPISRKNVVREAISIIVARLGAQDSQGEHEESGGGLRTITFADGLAHDIGDLNTNNLAKKWDHIVWQGGTRVLPGLRMVHRAFKEEFGARPQAEQPLLLVLGITDGEADDSTEFEQAIARLSGSVYMALAVLGFGPEHDKALATYRQIEASNAHVKVFSFAGETDPQMIADGLLGMIA